MSEFSPSVTHGPVYVLRDDGTFDHRLLFGVPDSPAYATLVAWARQHAELHPFVRDFHRLQIEYWLWLQVEELGPRRVLDVGVYHPRRWMSAGYATLGLDVTGTNDYIGDLTEWSTLPSSEPWDVVILTEVLEHTTDPHAALANVRRLLKPDGILLASTPFLWPDHHTATYPDFWRFTEQGWRLLLADWADIVVQPCAWSRMGRFAYELLADAECLGQQSLTPATTGYLVRARRP